MIYSENEIVEGFTYNGVHSKKYNLRLINRIDNTPTEKEVIENIPYMQGELDFSNILGTRVYENRFPTYEMLIVDYDYQRRKSIEMSLSNWLMKGIKNELYDDFVKNYYYVGKCQSIEYEDRYEGMTAIITFNAYPFKIGEYLEGNDIWDEFNFETDIAQITSYEINGSEQVTLYNGGNNLISPKVIASSSMEIIKGNQTFNVPQGESESYEFMLDLGENTLTINGNGTIEFQFYKEML